MMPTGFSQTANRIVAIAEKDVKIYFLKAPNLTFGLILPMVLYLAFALGRTVDAAFAVPGIVAIASFFGAGAIQAVSLPLERRTGTFNSLVTAPMSLFEIMLGKALAGFFFGIVLSFAYTLLMIPFSPVSNVALLTLGVLVSSFMFSTFGLLLSSPFKDIPQAMPPATVIRIAMVFLGAVFVPITMLPSALQIVAYGLPLTYSVSSLRQAWSATTDYQSFLVSCLVQLVFAAIFLIVATKILQRTID